jgi:hypothetical protein
VHESLLRLLRLLLCNNCGLFSPPNGQSDRCGTVAMLPQLCGHISSVFAESLTEACREHFHAAILSCHELRLQLARDPSEGCAECHSVDSLLLWERSQLRSR